MLKLRIVKFRLIPEDSEQLTSIIIGWRLRERALELGSLLTSSAAAQWSLPRPPYSQGRLWSSLFAFEWRWVTLWVKTWVSHEEVCAACWVQRACLGNASSCSWCWRELLIRGLSHGNVPLLSWSKWWNKFTIWPHQYLFGFFPKM